MYNRFCKEGLKINLEEYEKIPKKQRRWQAQKILKKLRSETKITQKDAAALIGIPIRTLQNWEHAINSPPKFVLEKIIEVYTQLLPPDKKEKENDR